MMQFRQDSKFQSFNFTSKTFAIFIISYMLLSPAYSANENHKPKLTGKDMVGDRREYLLRNQYINPFPSPNCQSDSTLDASCIWGQIASMMISLRLGAYESNYNTIREQAYSIQKAILQSITESSKLYNDGKTSNYKVLDFGFNTSVMLLYLIKEVNSYDNLDKEFKTEIIAELSRLYTEWAKDGCKLSDSSTDMIWHPWRSENLDIQRAHACWAASYVSIVYHGGKLPYTDGSTADRQYASWTQFFKLYIVSRARAGAPIEFFSPTYSKYFLNVFYSLVDFSPDHHLRTLGSGYITLWWAIWAQEQIQGVHGGGQTRAYINSIQRLPPLYSVAWIYFGQTISPPSHLHPAELVLALSSYSVPGIIFDIVSSETVLGSSWTYQIGLLASQGSENRYHVSEQSSGIIRYTYRTPSFTMGSVITRKLPLSSWSAISSQNRWSGVTLLGGQETKIFASPRPLNKSMYIPVFAAQFEDTMVVKKADSGFSKNLEGMYINIGNRLKVIENDGWIIAQGSAYVAIRPIIGGYRKLENGNTFALDVDTSPVVIIAAERKHYPVLIDFLKDIGDMKIDLQKDNLSMNSLRSKRAINIDISAQPFSKFQIEPVLDSHEYNIFGPHVVQFRGSCLIEIRYFSHDFHLRFC